MYTFLSSSLNARIVLTNIAVIGLIAGLSLISLSHIDKLEKSSITDMQIIKRSETTLNDMLRLTSLIRDDAQLNLNPFKRPLLENTQQYAKNLIVLAESLLTTGKVGRIKLDRLINEINNYSNKNNLLYKTINQIHEIGDGEIEPTYASVLLLIGDTEQQLFDKKIFPLARLAGQINTSLVSQYHQVALFRAQRIGHNKVKEHLASFAEKLLRFEKLLEAQQEIASHRLNNKLEEFLSALIVQVKMVQQRGKLEREINNLIVPTQFSLISEIILDIRSVASGNAITHSKNIKKARQNVFGVAAAMILIVILLGGWLRRRLMAQVRYCVSAAQKLAAGEILLFSDEENPAPSSGKQDEFALLAEYFNAVAKDQRRMLSDIKASCEDLASGRLDNGTDYSYKGDYLAIEKALNISRRTLQLVIEDIVRSCEYLAQGKLNISTKQIYVGDFKPIAQSINAVVMNLKHQVNDIVAVTASMSSGLDTKDRFLAPAASYQGDFIEIRDTLTAAVDNLRHSATVNSGQNWLKSGLSAMNHQMTGEQPLAVLCKNSIDFIAQYLDAPIGYMYRSFEEENHRGKALRMIAHFGVLMNTETRKTRYHFVYPEGVGLIGQAFVKPQLRVKELHPDERVSIEQSGIAYANPAFVAVLPLLHEGKVEGVLELGLYRELTEIQEEFLQQVMPSLGIAMNVAISRDRMNLLLAQSQRQAEALESQQEQLGRSNEMLQLKAHELEDKQQALEEKNDQLERAGAVLEERASELALASRYKSEFLANMSHELRSPLNSLLILAKLLTDNKKQHLDDSEVGYASVIYRSGTDLLHLIEDILDLSKIEAGKTDIDYSEVEVGPFIEKIASRFAEIAKQQHLSFNIDIELEFSQVRCDQKRLMQILANLLSNAFKFTVQGEVHLRVFKAAKGDELCNGKTLSFDALCYQVIDSGIGIAQEDHDRVFQAFQQADGTTNRSYGGTGLGLSISLQLVTLMQGVITLHSELDVGSTFSIYLPFIPLENLPQLLLPSTVPFSPIEIEAIDTQLQMIVDGPSIVLIGCDDALSTELKHLCTQRRLNVLAASDLGHAMQLLKQTTPIAVVCAETLPQSTMAIMLRRLKGLLAIRHLPFFSLCASVTQIQAIQYGACCAREYPQSKEAVADLFMAIVERCDQQASRLVVMDGDQGCTQALVRYLANDGIEIDTLRDPKELSLHADCVTLCINDELNASEIREVVQCCAKTLSPILLYAPEGLNDEQQTLVAELEVSSPVAIAGTEASLVLQANLYLHQQLNQLTVKQAKILDKYLNQTDVLKDKKILIVDDNMSNVFALSAILERLDVSVLIAVNGLEAMALAQGQQDIDMILMDIMMPEMDGYQTMQAIRKDDHYINTPIIALTAKAMPQDRLKCLQAGANDYLTKPVDESSLLEIMQNWLVVNPDQNDYQVEHVH